MILVSEASVLYCDLWTYMYMYLAHFIANLLTCILYPVIDQCIFEIYCLESKRTYLDNGCWRWCKCNICRYSKYSRFIFTDAHPSNQPSKNQILHYVLLCSILFENTYWFLLEISPKKVGDLGYASELGNYAEYSGAPNEEEVLQYARVVIDVRTMICVQVLHVSTFLPIYFSNIILCHCCLQCATADPDGRKRALLIGGGIANFTDVAATFNGIIRALKEKVLKLFFCLGWHSDFYSWGWHKFTHQLSRNQNSKRLECTFMFVEVAPTTKLVWLEWGLWEKNSEFPLRYEITFLLSHIHSIWLVMPSFLTAVILYLQTSELLVHRKLWNLIILSSFKSFAFPIASLFWSE